MIKLSEIEGLLVEKKDGIAILLDREGKEFASTRDHFKWGWNKAIDFQGQVSIGLNREKLANILYSKLKVSVWLDNGSGITQAHITDISFNKCLDAIISKEQELLEVKNERNS